MANIQPYEYQKRTNIEEHNDLVSKINEIIDVINQTNIQTILPKINKLEADVSAINDTDNVQNTDIANLKEKDNQIDNRLDTNESNVEDITKSLVSDVILMNGTTMGNMKARIGRENAPSIDSNDYNIQKPVSVELVQGSASAMVKAKITLSDGTVLISDDFMFTTEAIGTDVYISSFTFKNGNVAGTISADIGLSNGSTLEANNFVVPTDPNVISSISDLQSRMTAVESGTGDLTELKATVDGHTTSINELNTDVASLKTDKADVNNSNQTIVAGTVNATNINKGSVAVATVNDIPDISGKVNIAQGIENAGKVLGIGENGNVTPVNGNTGVEVWEEIDYSNPPTDWVNGDRLKIMADIGILDEHNTKIDSLFVRPIYELEFFKDSVQFIDSAFYPYHFGESLPAEIFPLRVYASLALINGGQINFVGGYYSLSGTGTITLKRVINENINITDFPTYYSRGQAIRVWRLKKSS